MRWCWNLTSLFDLPSLSMLLLKWIPIKHLLVLCVCVFVCPAYQLVLDGINKLTILRTRPIALAMCHYIIGLDINFLIG